MPIQWDEIENFEREEFDDPNCPGSGDLFDYKMLLRIARIRQCIGWPMISHAPVGGAVDVNGSWGHAEYSYHLKDMGACALDFHFITDAPTREQFHKMMCAGFTGLGIYYDWHWNGYILPVGFHIDSRSRHRTQVWKREDGTYIYLLN